MFARESRLLSTTRPSMPHRTPLIRTLLLPTHPTLSHRSRLTLTLLLHLPMVPHRPLTVLHLPHTALRLSALHTPSRHHLFLLTNLTLPTLLSHSLLPLTEPHHSAVEAAITVFHPLSTVHPPTLSALSALQHQFTMLRPPVTTHLPQFIPLPDRFTESHTTIKCCHRKSKI